MPTDPMSIPWSSRSDFERHYSKHRVEVGVRARDEYLRSARQTIQDGIRFTHTWKGGTRVGYYHRATRRFTALPDDESFIITHFVMGERQVRALRGSTYN